MYSIYQSCEQFAILLPHSLFNQEMVKISSEVQIKLAEEVEKMKVYLTKEAEKTRDDLISEINEMRRAIEVLTTTVRGSS